MKWAIGIIFLVFLLIILGVIYQIVKLQQKLNEIDFNEEDDAEDLEIYGFEEYD